MQRRRSDEVVRSYLDTTFNRLKELVDVVVVVFRRKMSGTRGDRRRRNLELD